MMREIQMSTFPISHLFKPRKNKREFNEDSYQGNNNNKKQRFNRQQDQKGDVERCSDLIPECSLSPEEKFGDVFHPSIKRSFSGTIPKLDNEEICHRYHSLGTCHSNCRFKKSHKKLPQQVASEWKIFCRHCKDENKRRSSAGTFRG